MLGHVLMTLAWGVRLTPAPNNGWLLRMLKSPTRTQDAESL